MFNFQDPTHNSACATYCERTVLDLLKKPVGNQYLGAVRILVPPEILVPTAISAQFQRCYLCWTDNFPDPIYKKDFGIYDPVVISNFAKKISTK